MPAYILRRKDNSKNGVDKCAKLVASDLITTPPEFENFKFLKISDEQALLVTIIIKV